MLTKMLTTMVTKIRTKILTKMLTKKLTKMLTKCDQDVTCVFGHNKIALLCNLQHKFVLVKYVGSPNLVEDF